MSEPVFTYKDGNYLLDLGRRLNSSLFEASDPRCVPPRGYDFLNETKASVQYVTQIEGLLNRLEEKFESLKARVEKPAEKKSWSLMDTITLAIYGVRKAGPWDKAFRGALGSTGEDLDLSLSFAGLRLLAEELGFFSYHFDKQGDIEKVGGLFFRIDNTIAPALFKVVPK